MRTIAIVLMIAVSAVLIIISVLNPGVITSNSFLANFVNHEILNIQAVVVTVTLVSITQVHLEFTRIERRYGERFFQEARDEINRTATMLVSTFLLMVLILIFRGGTEPNGTSSAILSSLTLVLFVAGVLSMVDIARTICVLASEEPLDMKKEDQE